jgi:hypothetical protein
MQLENHFYNGRSSRWFVSRRGDAAFVCGGKMLAERSGDTGPSPYRPGHRSVVQDPPGGNDGMRHARSNPLWRATATVMTNIVAVVDTCGELLICRVLLALASRIFEQALEGCAAYATAMHGIPAHELRDSADEPAAGHQHPDRILGSTSVESAESGIATCHRDIEYLMRRGDRRE